MRIGLSGGGTDVPPIADELGGTTLSASIDLYATCRVESSDGRSTIITNDCNGTRYRFACSSVPADLGCTLPGAAYLYSMQKWNQGSLAPMEIRVSSDVAVGSGMGGSSALTVAMLLALSRFLDIELGKKALSSMAHAIESKQLGLLAGTQDSIASTHGGIQFVEHLRSDNSVISNVAIDKDFRSMLENSFILANTQVSRLSTPSHSDQCLQYRQATSFVERVVSDLRGATRAMKHALEAADFDAVGQLFKQACHFKILLNPSACLETVGIRPQEVKETGAIALKLCGAGNGGYVLAMARPECYDNVWKFLADRFGFVRSVAFVDEGAHLCDAH